MSSDAIAISVTNLSKRYEIYDSPRDRLKQFVSPHWSRITGRKPKQFFQEFWALRDISFEVRRGEAVGIIGRNGSGKSTLLQMICGTLTPTSGSVQTNGRIAALLELGSGFNPEFSGRENVYINGAVLGLGREAIDLRFDDIAAFADIGAFLEQPVKTYSSGMVLRLAFAVAINIEPDILILDEALAVGDELFQRKCFSRIEGILANGSTIMFVSHSGAQIVELCDRAILLDSGEQLASGLPKKIVGSYQKLIYAPAERSQNIRSQIRQSSERNMELESLESDELLSLVEDTRELRESFDPDLKPTSTIEYESHGAYIGSAEILTLTGEQVNGLVRGNSYRFAYTVEFVKSATNVRFAMLIKTTSGVELGGAESASAPRGSLACVDANSIYRIEFSFLCALNPGVYFMNAGVIGESDGAVTYLHRVIDVGSFKVLPERDHLGTGIVDFGFQSTIELGNCRNGKNSRNEHQ